MNLRWVALALFALVVAVWHTFGDAPFYLKYPQVGSSPDAQGTFWMYDWVAQEVLAGRFPIRTDRMFYPEGMNFLVLNGANVVDAILSVPLQLWLGTGRGELWTCVLIVVGNALTFFPLARRLAPGRPDVAILVTFWWTVNPYVLTELAAGRPTQAMLWFVPPAAAALLRSSGWRDAVVLGLAVGAQGLVYWYTPVFFAVVFVPVAVVKLLGQPRLAGWYALSVALAILVVAPLAWPIVQASRAGEIPGLDQALESTGMWLESRDRTRRLFEQFGLLSTLVVLVGAAARWRRDGGLAVGMVFGLIFAVGARLSAYGQDIANPAYTFLFEHSSFISRLNFPARILSVVYCAAAIGVIPVLTASRVRILPALLLVLVILEGRANHLARARVLAAPPLPASEIVRVNPGPVLSTPVGAPDTSMVQQAFHRQPLVSGMGDHVATVRSSAYADWLVNPYFSELVQADDLMRPWKQKDSDEVKAAVRWVWFDRALLARGPDSELTGTIEARLTVVLGQPYYADSHTAIWDLTRPGSTATEAELALVAAADAVLEAERDVCDLGPLRGVRWPFGPRLSERPPTR